MKVVYKYRLQVQEFQTLQLPLGAALLSVQQQDPWTDDLQLWALVDPAASSEQRTFCVAGTGRPLPLPAEKLRYVATAQMRGGDLVWHVFEALG